MTDIKYEEVKDEAPQEGDDVIWDREEPLEGKYVKKETDVGPNKSNMYHIETEEGVVKAWGSTVLDNLMARVPLDTNVKIKCEGKPAGKNYYTYKLGVEEGTALLEPDGTKKDLDDIDF